MSMGNVSSDYKVKEKENETNFPTEDVTLTLEKDWSNKYVQSRNLGRIADEVIEPSLMKHDGNFFGGCHLGLKLQFFSNLSDAESWCLDGKSDVCESFGYCRTIGVPTNYKGQILMLEPNGKDSDEDTNWDEKYNDIMVTRMPSPEQVAELTHIMLEETPYPVRMRRFAYANHSWVVASLLKRNGKYQSYLFLYDPGSPVSFLLPQARDDFGFNVANALTSSTRQWQHRIAFCDGKHRFGESENSGKDETKNVNLMGNNITNKLYKLSFPDWPFEFVAFSYDELIVTMFETCLLYLYVTPHTYPRLFYIISTIFSILIKFIRWVLSGFCHLLCIERLRASCKQRFSATRTQRV